MLARDFLNPITNTDFYKTGHLKQYPEGTELVFSNLTPRSNKHFPKIDSVPFDGVVVFGIQAAIRIIHERFEDCFFSKPKEEILEYYKKRMDMCLGVDSVDVEHIGALHDLGFLPITIRSLTEGTKAPIGCPVFTIENTSPEFFWVVNYLETVLSNETWFPMTAATIADTFRRLIKHYGVLTQDSDRSDEDKALDSFLCHDFSMRGMMGSHAAAISSSAHLTSFTGTDSIPALDYIDYFYGTTPDDFVAGSVPATEHSVMCMSEEGGEFDLFKRLITETYPTGIVSIVSDTWDFWKVVSEYMPELKEVIMSREGTLTLRPDSGDPADILCGYDIYDMEGITKEEELRIWGECGGLSETHLDFVFIEDGKYNLYSPEGILKGEISKWEAMGAVESLWEIFGGTTNSKGYRTLDSHIGLIYGDSITLPLCEEILMRLMGKKFTHNNVVFGLGSYTYQYNTRDTLGFAVKATAGCVNGKHRSIQKKPLTDKDASKVSAKGYLKVVKDNAGDYELLQDVPYDSISDEDNELKLKYVNGFFYNDEHFFNIRSRVQNS